MFQLRGCTVHLESDEVQCREERVPLTRAEALLLRYLVENANRIIHRDELNEAVLGYHPNSRSRALNTLIQRLRRKIEVDPHRPDHLLTVYGKGFRFQLKRTLPDRRAGNISGRSTTFVGRVRELNTVRDALTQTRRMVLLGPAGFGKTRLAEEYALMETARYPGGCWMCDLSGARTAADVSLAVARSLDLALLAAPNKDRLEARIGISMRAMGPLLLIADASEGIISLLDRPLSTWVRAADMHILVTSRVRLGLMQWPTLDLRGLPHDAACELYRHRSAGRDDEDETSIAHLMALLDGAPTAIEFAAARARTTSTKATLTAMRDGSVSGVPAIQHALQWVWSRLSEDERTYLARSTIFRTPFRVEDVAGVVLESPEDVDKALAVIQTLQDHGLLLRTTQDDGQTVYCLLQSARRFAAPHIDAQVATAHASWVGDRLLAVSGTWRTTTAQPYSSLCREHLEDFIAARETAVDLGQHDMAHRLGLALIPFLYHSGPATRFLEIIDDSLEHSEQPLGRAEILTWRAAYRIATGEIQAARSDLRTAIHAVGWRGRTAVHGRIWHLMARIAWSRKPTGLRLFEHCIEVLQDAGAEFEHALAASELAQRMLSAAIEEPDPEAMDKAKQQYERAKVACAAAESPYADAVLSWCVSYVDRLDGRFEDARQRLLVLRDQYLALCSPVNAWAVECSLAYLAWWTEGDYGLMAQHLLAAQRLAGGFGSTHLSLRTAAVLYEAEPSHRARDWLEQSLRDTLFAGDAPIDRIRARARLALFDAEVGELRSAIQTLDRCLKRCVQYNNTGLDDEVAVGLGMALLCVGSWRRARTVFADKCYEECEDMAKRRVLRDVLIAACDFMTDGVSPTSRWRTAATFSHGLGEGRLLGIANEFLHAVGETPDHDALPNRSPRGAILPHERRLAAQVADLIRTVGRTREGTQQVDYPAQAARSAIHSHPTQTRPSITTGS